MLAQGGAPAPPSASRPSVFNYFRAEDYGAAALPGKVDSSGGINLAAAVAAAAGGGLVVLDSGKTYGARFTVNLPPNVELMIPTGTTLQAQAGLVGDLVAANAAAGVRISGGGSIDANRAGSGMQGNGVTLTGCVEAQIEEVAILNAYTDGLALVNCTRTVVDVFAGANGRHGIYHNGSTFGRGQVTVRDNGQRVAGHGVCFDGASTDNGYGPLVATDTRIGGAKTQQYGVFEVPASGCDRNTFAPSTLTGNAAGTVSLVGANSGTPLAPGSVTAAAIANGAVSDAQVNAAAAIQSTKFAGYPWHNADLSADVARANQLVNGGFEIFQRGNGPWNQQNAYTGDRWLLSFSGAPTAVAVSKIASTIGSPGSSLSLAHTPAGGSAFYLSQQFGADCTFLLGKTVTFAVQVKAANGPGTVRLSIQDSVNGNRFSAYNVGNNVEETLSVTAAIAANATTVGAVIALDSAAQATVEVNDARLVVGTVAPSYVPLHPYDELARCQRYYEAATPSTYLPGAGMTFNTTGALIVWTFKVRKGGSPTITVSNLAGWNVLQQGAAGVTPTAGAADSIGPDAARLNFTCPAASFAAGGQGTLASAGGLTAEWNP